MITSHIKLCPYCGGIARDIESMQHHTRAACEQRITERIAHHEQAAARERESLAALHAVKASDWSGALS